MKESTRSIREGITGNALKIIAIVTMFIDHIGVALIENGILEYRNFLYAALNTPEGNFWSGADLALRTVGRLAFPIFCFLLTEGFLHTRDVKKYGARLLVFAFISEIPFDLALFDRWFYPGYQNVYFTLFIGLCVLEWYRKTAGRPVMQLLAVLSGCGASILLKCDYNAIGILMILLFYVFHENKRLQTLYAGILAAFESLGCFGAAVLAFIPIRMYNGKRGETNLKYFFYWFYPVHLFFLYLVRLIIMNH
ncbi:TraX family protein [Lachnospiraceae bacterium 54-53]